MRRLDAKFVGDADACSNSHLHRRDSLHTFACGDLSGYDADANYDLPATDGPEGYAPIEPVQMPTTPAYRAYMERQQGVDGRRTVLDEQWSAGAQAPELT